MEEEDEEACDDEEPTSGLPEQSEASPGSSPKLSPKNRSDSPAPMQGGGLLGGMMGQSKTQKLLSTDIGARAVKEIQSSSVYRKEGYDPNR